MNIPSVFVVIVVWTLLASLLTAVLYAWDKRAARRDAPRIRERTLLLWSLAGGWPGGWLAGQRLRHKTQKLSFRIRFVICALVNIAAVVALLMSLSFLARS